MQKIKINNNQECAVIDIEGTIGVPEQWQFDDPQQRVATYERFRTSLAAIEEIGAPEVVVNIRSTGGDVGDALLIYDALSTLDAEITTRCWGYVASAATVIAQAASEGLREISPNSLYLIHSSTCSAEGNASDLTQRAELLRKSDERLAEIYARRSGLDVTLFEELMAEGSGEGRWLSATEAIEAGLADRLIETAPITTQLSEGIEGALNTVRGVMRKIGDKLRGEQSTEVSDSAPEQETQQRESPSQQEKVISTQSQVAFEAQQQSLKATDLPHIEDPSFVESPMLSANAQAYNQDARRISR